MASASSTTYFPLATEEPYTGYDGADPYTDGSAEGASGSYTGGIELTRGALIAIIVVVVLVAIAGITSAALFFVAKKREWTMKETIRRSARKVVTALTPRRSEFPRSVKETVGGGSGRGGRVRLDDVPPTPRIKSEHLDLEKGSTRSSERKGGANFSRK